MAATAEELRALFDRVRKATGPDREIDYAVFAWERGATKVEVDPYDSAGPRFYLRPGGEVAEREIGTVTASIDAAVALVERVLPGWSLQMNLSEGLTHPCVVMGRSHPTNKTVAMEHFTLPLAILAAMLSALIALATTEAPAQRGDGER